MKSLTNYQTGILNQFNNHFPKVEFNHEYSNEHVELFDVFNNDSPDEINGMFEDSEKTTWFSTFIDINDSKEYIIIADDSLNSSGRYVVAEIINTSSLN